MVLGVVKIMVSLHEAVLVTGANGFVGREVTKKLAESGRMPFSTDITLTGNRYLDVTDYDRCWEFMNKIDPEIIVHLGALVAGKPSIDRPYDYFKVNVLGTLNILEAMRTNNSKYLIYVSSWSIYGVLDDLFLPITEQTRQYPENPYGASKVMCETAVKTYANLFGIKTIILRPTMIYGPNQPEKNVVQQLVDCMLTKETFELYGKGEHTRECLYITDMADAVVKAIENVYDQKSVCEVYVVGTGKPYRIKDIAKMAQNISGFPLKFVPSSKWAFSQSSDITKIKHRLGWTPKVSLREGLEKCLKSRGKTLANFAFGDGLK